MIDKKREKADQPPPPPQPFALTLPSPLSIKLEPETSMSVSILPPEKPAPKLGRGMILLAATFISLTFVWALLFWTHIVRQIHSPLIAVSGTPLSATMAHPARVAFGDEAEIEITVVNNGGDTYAGALTLTFQGDAPASPLPNETTSIEIKNLIAKASATYRVKFALGPKSWAFGGGAIGASLQAYSGTRPMAAVPASVIPIARLPYARYLLDEAVVAFEDARHLTYGEEFYQSLRLITSSLHCDGLQDIAKLRDEFKPLFEIDQPLRPQFIAVFRGLRDAAIDAASFLSAAHEITRRDALLKAGGALEEARQLADEVYEPERSLLLAAIEHWRRMFAVEGGRVAEQREVETLPNPYVAGRPINPNDGRLFAGRRDEFRTIEEKLQTGVGLIVYGQRRIGKSSILLHLRERLPHDLLPVYLNLQRLMAQTTGGFMQAVAREILKQLPPQSAIRIPPSEEFAREPYLSFNHVLDEIAAQLGGAQRVLLAFDEFEELEKRVAAGEIDQKIFTYLRGVTQTGSRFSLLFCGLHTLEEMTHDYWNPFFQSVQTVRIAYLSELDSRQLIADPIDQFPLRYDEEAIERITALTRSHPYLAQSVCHNLVNRLNDPLTRSNRATAADMDAVLDRTLESSGYYFDDYVWGWSNDNQRLALSLLAEAGEEAEFAVVERHLGRKAALDATRGLVARDILAERSDGERLLFRFQIPLSRMWVRRTKSSARILLERGID